MIVFPLSLYVHIPFCTRKCRYCDFNSYAKLEHLMPSFTEALCDEARLWGNVMLRSSYESLRTSGRDGTRRRRVQTVFFGGGTPSLMPLPDLERIFAALRDSFDVAPEAEVSLEANPGTVGPEYLRGLLRLGVNRISFGVQSFHDDELLALGRIHSAKEARDSFLSAREAGFRRITLDLIYGVPGQTLERWRSNVEEAISLRPEHLSLYALTIEEGTKLARDIERGRTDAPDPDLQADMYGWSQERLARAGYRQYEISNWAMRGEECRHNLAYWHNGEWLGLGPGAHSHLFDPGSCRPSGHQENSSSRPVLALSENVGTDLKVCPAHVSSRQAVVEEEAKATPPIPSPQIGNKSGGHPQTPGKGASPLCTPQPFSTPSLTVATKIVTAKLFRPRPSGPPGGGEDAPIAYRFACVSSPGQYIRKVRETASAGIDVADGLASVLQGMRQVGFIEPQSREMEMADTAILSLRLNEGLRSAEFRNRFGLAPDEAYPGPLRELTSLGLLERKNGAIRLTDRGRYLSNEVFVRLLP